MAHSERVCRVGALALAPIVVIGVGALVSAVSAGVCWGTIHLFPSLSEPAVRDPHAGTVTAIIALSILGVLIVTLFASGLYPYLYRHCQGAEVLAKFEALDQEDEAISKAHNEKMADLNRRRTELMISLRGGSNAKAEDV